MGRFTPLYTPEQEAAIAGAMLGDIGRPMSARQACEAAAAGQLGLEPFVVKPKTAYVLRDRHEARRAPPKPRGGASLEDRAAALLEARMARMERDAARGKLDVEELRRLVRCAAELRRGRKDPPAAGSVETPSSAPVQEGHLARLARLEREKSEGATQGDGSSEATQPATTPGDVSTPH